MNSSTKASEFYKNSFWSITGAVISRGLIVISWVIVARILGEVGYGQFGIIRSTVLMFATFASFSLGITASKHVAEFFETDKSRVTRIIGLTLTFGLIMGSIVGIIFFISAPWLASSSLKSPEITTELQVTSIILFFSALNGAQTGVLQGLLEFKKIAVINIIQAIICFPLFILGALYLGVHGTIWALTISYILTCLFSQIAIKKSLTKYKLKIDIKNAFQEKDILFKYSLPAFLSGLMVAPIKWIADSILVSKGGFGEMGVFTAALTINNIIIVAAGMLSAPFIAVMAKNKNDSRNSKFSKFNILAPWAIGIFICLPFIALPELGGIIFGKSFASQEFEHVFIIVLLYTILIMFNQGLARIIAVHNLQWWGLLSNFVWGLILISTFLTFNVQNAVFLSISYLIAYFLHILFFLPLYFKKKLIPQKSIISLNSLYIWTTIIGVTFSGICLNSIILRILILLTAITIVTIFLLKIFKNNVNLENN